MGGLASIASLGMSDGNSKKGSKAIAIAQSREFFDHLLTFENVLVNLMAVKSFNAEESSNIYDESTYDSVKKRWIASQPPNWIAYKEYNEVLTINFDAKSNFVTMSVSHRSPQFAQEFLELIIRELNLLSRNRALQQSQASLNYLYEELGSSQLNDVRLAISQLIETQLKTQMLARVKVDYSLESVDKPYFPNERTSPQRKKITFIALFLGIFLSTFLVLIRFFLKKSLN
jgi:capsular polysaccharide biosynthesis protein